VFLVRSKAFQISWLPRLSRNHRQIPYKSPLGGMPSSLRSGQLSLNAQSKGVVGIRNLELGDNSVLTSSGKEVKLH
jgi:hypothetical protein